MDKNTREVSLYASELYLTTTNICQRSLICKIADINFKSAKKMKEELDKAIDCMDSKTTASANVKQLVAGHLILADAKSSFELPLFYTKLTDCSAKPALLRLIYP